MAAAVLFDGCFLPPLRAICAFAGDEDAAALRYLCSSTRALLPLSDFSSLLRPETLRGTLCVEAAAELSASRDWFAPSLVAALLNPHSIRRVSERARGVASFACPTAAAAQGPKAEHAAEAEPTRAPQIPEVEEADTAPSKPGTEAAEDAGAARLVAWALSGSRIRYGAAAEGSIRPLLQINEAHVYALLRCARYRRRLRVMASAGLLHTSDPAYLSSILARGLRCYADTLVYMLGLASTRAAAARSPLVVYSRPPPPALHWPPLDPFGLTAAQRAEVAELMIYPPPLRIDDVAAMAADLAHLERALCAGSRIME